MYLRYVIRQKCDCVLPGVQVDQLHKALRGRAPANSLAAVVAAARPSAEESAAALELRERVEELEGQLRHKVWSWACLCVFCVDVAERGRSRGLGLWYTASCCRAHYRIKWVYGTARVSDLVGFDQAVCASCACDLCIESGRRGWIRGTHVCCVPCAQDEEFEAQLRAYQQQFEKLKAQYAERAGRLEAATKVGGGSGSLRLAAWDGPVAVQQGND